MAKVYKTEWYEARHLTGSGRLADTWEMLKDAKKGIDKANKRMEQRGYLPETFLITKTVSEAEWTDKDKFKRRSTIETSIQIYPKEAK